MNTRERLNKIKNGQDYSIYEFLGCHLATKGGVSGAYFRVYAPNAKEIYVVGDFNDWDRQANPLTRLPDSNVWECFVKGAKNLHKYKYIVVASDGTECAKSDPYAFYSQVYGNDNDFASYVYNIDGYSWSDKKYLEKFNQINHLDSPMNIYEVCLMTWKKHADGSYYTYRELATSLVQYCKKMGYTHIELLPITESPYDISLGYQITGYFAATSRFGKPKDLMYFIDKCHEAGIAVILDWVPGHFINDSFGLIDFDGTSLYESPKWDRKRQLAWGTRIFDYEDPYVVQFLISSALFFMRKFHFDGLRIDAVSSILYLDFCRNPDEWIPNMNGGNINYAGVEFIKNLNNTVFSEFPNAIMVAEEVTGYPMVTRPTTVGGLGYNFKWNIGWMNDIWEYTSMDPHFRKYHHDIITHSIEYCFDENYILPVDHDEVGNGRHSLFNKMNGDFNTKMDMCRAFFIYMFMHPGKKLTFMGSEFGQIAEWTYNKPINFLLLKAEKNKKLSKFITALNKLYLASPEMWERDFDKNAYVWLVRDDNFNCVNAFQRYSHSGSSLICICNFSPYRIPDYVLGVDESGAYEEVLSSDDEAFGGGGEHNETMYSSIMNKNGRTNAIRVTLPPNSAIILRKIQKD
ncbi:MAG: 1,4-alpha-glucan branching protein GlgB [Clostridia bacterium]|nr:1,4-alpha-glucan branching protein GlgB [Clostridia bacterium]